MTSWEIVCGVRRQKNNFWVAVDIWLKVDSRAVPLLKQDFIAWVVREGFSPEGQAYLC